MKTVGVMQPYFMPYIGYWQLINVVDTFVLFDDVNWIKKGWINRNRILINGKDFLFTVPISNVSQNRFICEHRIVNEECKDILWETIKNAYRHAPQWKNIEKMLEDIIKHPTLNIVDYIEYALICICRYLNISTNIIRSSNINNDKSLKAQDKIIDICNILEADLYINPIGGVDLYDDSAFRANKMELRFIYTEKIEYKQFCDEFLGNLSILDMLCFLGKEEVTENLKKCRLLTKYEIKMED